MLMPRAAQQVQAARLQLAVLPTPQPPAGLRWVERLRHSARSWARLALAMRWARQASWVQLARAERVPARLGPQP